MLRAVLVCVGSLLLVFLFAGARRKWWPDLSGVFWIEFAMGLIAGAGALAAVFGCTAGDSREPRELDHRAHRFGARLAAAGCLLSIGAGAFVRGDPYFSVAVAAAVLWATAFVYTFGHVARKMAHRAASPSLAAKLGRTARAMLVEIMIIAMAISYVVWHGGATPSLFFLVLAVVVLLLLFHMGLFVTRAIRLTSLLASLGWGATGSRERQKFTGSGAAETDEHTNTCDATD